jgi:GNAT superfamily N-acetyltransferase
MQYRTLARDEVERVWSIDRRERIERVYRWEDGALRLEQHHFDVPGFQPGRVAEMTPELYACFDRGGVFYAACDGEVLAGAAALDTLLVGVRRDLLQLLVLYVGRDYRGHGIGATLFEHALAGAAGRGARGLYVSATPTENTVHFYQGRGCRLLEEPDPALFAREPEDIHFERLV